MNEQKVTSVAPNPKGGINTMLSRLLCRQVIKTTLFAPTQRAALIPVKVVIEKIRVLFLYILRKWLIVFGDSTADSA